MALEESSLGCGGQPGWVLSGREEEWESWKLLARFSDIGKADSSERTGWGCDVPFHAFAHGGRWWPWLAWLCQDGKHSPLPASGDVIVWSCSTVA